MGEDNLLLEEMAADMKAMSDVMYFVESPYYLNIGWLYDKQKQIIREYYDQEHKPKPYQDMVLVIGMRGGKTTIASICTVYELAKLLIRGDPMSYYGLPPGSEIFLINVATSDRQAKDTVFAAVKARIHNAPFFKRFKFTEHANEFIFPVANDGRVIIRSEHSNSASLAGKTVVVVVFDELARFKDTGGNSSAEMVYDTLSRAVKTFGEDGRRIAISSPMFENDYHMKLFRWGETQDHVYTLQCPTWEINPTITFKQLQPEFEKNPEAAWRDFGGIPSKALEPYFKEDNHIDLCTRQDKNPLTIQDIENWDTGEIIKTPWLSPNWRGKPNVPYFGAGDPSFKNDAFGIAIGHLENNQPFIDILFRVMPRMREDRKRTEIDASLIKQFYLQVQKQCWLVKVVFDTWNYPEAVQAIQAQGIEVEQNVVAFGEYEQLKEKINLVHTSWPEYYVEIPGIGEVLMPNWELRQLERKGNKVDHPPNASKDVSDAVANTVDLMIDPTNTDTYQEPIFTSVEL